MVFLTRPTISVSFPILVPFVLTPRGSRTGERVKDAFWRERWGGWALFHFPRYSTLTHKVCVLYSGRKKGGEGRGGRKGKGFRNGLFLDGECVVVQEEGNCYLHISPSQSGMDLHPPSRLAGTNRSSRHRYHHHRRMDGNAVSQTFISTRGREGGSRHRRRETEGRGGGVISCDWGSSVKGRGTRWRGSFSLMRFRDLLENSINLSRFYHGLPLFACGAGSSPLWRARSFSPLIDRPSDLKESEDGDGPGRTDWLHTNHH